MSAQHYYSHCQQYINQPVEIRTHDGECHHGIVHSVNQTHVYLRPFDGTSSLQGPGLHFFGAFAGGFLGGLTGVALGNIAFFRPYPFFF